jgi:hypothetical protein
MLLLGYSDKVPLGPNRFNTQDNTRIHVYFHHRGCGLIFWHEPERSFMKEVLKSVWSYFDGQVTDTYYHQEFSFGFITFANHDQAELALAGMRDEAMLRLAIDAAVARNANPAKAQICVDRIFVMGPTGGLIRPSWAAPRQPRFTGGPIR